MRALTLTLLPAALIAQAPADFTTLLNRDGAAVEQQLAAFQPLEAMAKADALLPAAIPAFDKGNPQAALASSFQFSSLTRLYILAARAAVQAGDWEKGVECFAKAKAVAEANRDNTKAALTPLIQGWTDAVENAKRMVEQMEPAVKAIKAKPGLTAAEEAEVKAFLAKDQIFRTTKDAAAKREAAKFCQANLARFQELEAKTVTDQDKADLKAFEVHSQNLQNGPKTVAKLQENIDITSKEAETCGQRLEAAKKNVASEAEENTKGLAEFKVNGKVVKETAGPKFEDKKAKYFESILNTKANYESRPGKLDKLNFLFRLRHNAQGTPVQAKVDGFIEKVRQDQDPLATPAKGKGKAKK